MAVMMNRFSTPGSSPYLAQPAIGGNAPIPKVGGAPTNVSVDNTMVRGGGSGNVISNTQPTPQPTPNTNTPPPNQADANNPYRQMFNFQAQSQSGTSGGGVGGNSGYYNISNGNPSGLSPQMQALMDSGAISSTAGMYGGDGAGGGDTGWNINYDKAPMITAPNGKQVSAQYFTPTDQNGSNLQDPSQKFYDPNYGWVGASQNNSGYKKDGWDMLYNAAPSLFLGGMTGMIGSAASAASAAGDTGSGLTGWGGMGGGGQLMKAPQLASDISRGGNPISALSGAAMSYAGVPSYLKPFLQYGINDLTTHKPPNGGGG